jgi:hypothetical protein
MSAYRALIFPGAYRALIAPERRRDSRTSAQSRRALATHMSREKEGGGWREGGGGRGARGGKVTCTQARADDVGEEGGRRGGREGCRDAGRLKGAAR